MNWGKSIVLTFIIFAGIIITMVTISMKQDISLVAKDYYVQEIAYQDQIDRINNKNSMEIKPVVNVKDGLITLAIHDTNLVNGEVHFFRPSDASLDKKYKLALDVEGRQQFTEADFDSGFWRIKVNWTKSGREYYSEHSIVVQ